MSNAQQSPHWEMGPGWGWSLLAGGGQKMTLVTQIEGRGSVPAHNISIEGGVLIEGGGGLIEGGLHLGVIKVYLSEV